MFTRSMIAAALVFATSSPLLAADLRVEIKGIDSADGTVNVALFNRADQFLSKPLAGVKISAKQKPVIAAFPNLKPGAYAISTYHDANENGDLDTNLIGRPTEKYGFSRDAEVFMGPPTFDQAAVRINSDNQTIVINLR